MKVTPSGTGGRKPSGANKAKPATAKSSQKALPKKTVPRKPTIRFDYDVCVSFAGENRELVRDVVGSLKRRRITCFYDFDEQATLIGKNLFTYLDEVYRKKARFCIMFISEHYPLKQWTNHERQSIQARMFESTDDYLIPVRLDDTEVPGVLSTIGYLDGRRLSVPEIAALIQTKVRGKVRPKKPVKPKIALSTRSVTWTHMTNLRKLRKALTDPIALTLLNLTAARAGQRVPFSEVLKSAGESNAARGKIALSVLSKTIKREFGLPPDKVTWPVEKIVGTAGSSETQYRMHPDVAEAWLKIAA